MSKQVVFHYGQDVLTPGRALALARGTMSGEISGESRRRVEACTAHVERMARGDLPVYGVNTGFGPLCTTRISAEDTRTLQKNILMSHSSGLGEPIDPFLSRLMLVPKVHAPSKGHSGIRLETLDRLLWHLDQNIIPVVPCQGSVGASGDLAPLSHLFLPLLGLGHVWDQGQARPALQILLAKGKKPLDLGPKEGLALINGTQFMASHGVWALERLHDLLDLADMAGALSLEALAGSVKTFGSELHALRPHPGVRYVAGRLRTLLKDSGMVKAHEHCGKVQDPYSLRCMPQIHGASRQVWAHLNQVLSTEINGVTDNPVILDSGEAISGGHFHGQPIALPLDFAAMGASELGNVADRRIYLLLLGNDQGLPRLLLPKTGLQSGFMIPQYTSAALTTENKTLCFPASVDSIPTSLGQEDHVSMGSISARKLHRVLDNLTRIVAIEWVCAAQGMSFRRPLRSTPVLEAMVDLLRTRVPLAEDDRVFADDLNAAEELIRTRQAVEALRNSWPSDEEGEASLGEAFQLN